MARLLVQLKLRLLRNALRASTGAQIAFILSTLLALVIAIVVFYLLAILPSGIAGANLTTLIFCMFGLAWLVLPLMIFGLDSTLDPATLALYPLRTRPLAVGLLAASATGAWPTATLIGLLGVTIGLARGAFGVLIAHQPGRSAALAAREGLRRPAVHPALRGVRGLLPDRAEAGLRARVDRFDLRGRRQVAAMDTAGPGRARDL